MSSDKFDNKVREAADHHHPDYDEQAWSKMEKLLDKHLPVEDNRKRRIIFFLLFLMLLTGGGLFLGGAFNQNKEANKKELVEAQRPDKTREKNYEIQNNQTSKNNTAPPRKQEDIKPNGSALAIEEMENKTIIPVVNKKGDKKNYKVSEKIQKKDNKRNTNSSGNAPELKNKVKYNIKKDSLERTKKTNKDHAQTTATSIRLADPASRNDNEKNNAIPDSDLIKSLVVKKSQLQNNDKEYIGKPDSSSVKKKNKKKNSLFFTFSAGPGISFARTEKAGKLKSVSGIGAGLTLGNKFTIRTGFYADRKVYSSSPGSYNPPPSFYTYYPYLEKVDADCKVYEIPLSLSYNFSRSAKGYWFTSAGLSTYRMKKETYNYTYKYTPAGQSLNKEWTIKNENNHFFSVLTFSGGYRRQLGKSAFIMIEPNLKLPLTGIGYGKVKLNSAGILFSFGITPFSGAKK